MLSTFFNVPREDTSLSASETWKPTAGVISIRDFSYSYSGKEEHCVISKLNATILGTERISILGRSGSGKSSLSDALLRLHGSPVHGSIDIDVVNIESLPLHTIRSRVQVFSQEDALFNGTLRHNIDPGYEYTDHEIWEALEKVSLRDYFLNQHAQLDTMIAEHGSNIPMGISRLILFTRVLLSSAKIIILDEPFASLDASQARLLDSLMKQFNATVILITSRLKAYLECDRILVFNKLGDYTYETPKKHLAQAHGFVHELASG